MVTVLVADNDPGVRALLADVVRREGFTVRTADDGEEARCALGAGPVDLLVCDLDMPRLSGLQVLRWVASQDHQPAVVVVSGYLDARVTGELQQLPFVRAILRKPFDLFEFVRLLRELAAPGAVGEGGPGG